MKLQVIINDKYLQSQGIYRYSIVDVVKTHKIRGYVVWYKATYKGGDELYYRPHEVKPLEPQNVPVFNPIY